MYISYTYKSRYFATVSQIKTSTDELLATQCRQMLKILRGSLNAVISLGHKLQGNLNVINTTMTEKYIVTVTAILVNCKYNQVSTTLQSL